MRRERVVVVGGGLAGIAAALRLAERGVPVVLMESTRRLGGRAASFVDPRTGQEIDNCQHVVLGCCTNYRDLCQRLRVARHFSWHERQYWVEPGGQRSVIEPGSAPAPLHHLGSFARAKFLTLNEKLAIAHALGVMLLTRRDSCPSWTFGEFLASLDQPVSTITKFWSPVVVSACNLDVRRVSAAAALHVFQDGLLAHRESSRIGIPTVPLARLYADATEIISAAGGEIRFGVRAESISPRHIVDSTGREHRCAAVISAVPLEKAARTVRDADGRPDARLTRAAELQTSPICGIHLSFDRSVMDVPHAVLVGCGTQWVFDKGRGGADIHAVVSAADEWMEFSEAEIVARVVRDVAACFPASLGAALRSSRVVKEKRATFAATPQSQDLRPVAGSGTGDEVVLAGDYTATGWPATMEGATRSGYIAAARVLGLKEGQILAPEPRPAWLSMPFACCWRELN